MGSATEVILVITFAFAAIRTVQTNHSLSNYSYDITKSLSSCISKLFCNAKTDQVHQFINNIENYDRKTFEFEYPHEKEPFHNKFFFSAINITTWRKLGVSELAYVNCTFRDNKLVIFSPKPMFQVYAQVGAVKDTVYLYYHPMLYFANISVSVTKLPKNYNEADKFSVNYTYDWLSVSFRQEYKYVEEISLEGQAELEGILKKSIPSLVYENIITNTKFAHTLDENFLSQPGNDLNLTHPKFLTNEQQHYYYIPNIPFYWFNLRNITIRGLCNFETFNINKTLSKGTNTLVVKNVRGNLTLDYGYDVEEPLELGFIVDSVFISVNFLKNETNVETRDYHVIRTVLDTPLSDRQAALIMQKIESTVALSIWPSMRTWRNDNQASNMYESEIGLKKVFADSTQKPDLKSIKQLFTKWIPFHDN